MWVMTPVFWTALVAVATVRPPLVPGVNSVTVQVSCEPTVPPRRMPKLPRDVGTTTVT